jgi:hypothetical protein
MAFGNGAADIFGMLVEVVATGKSAYSSTNLMAIFLDSPKADLAIGQLLGRLNFMIIC